MANEFHQECILVPVINRRPNLILSIICHHSRVIIWGRSIWGYPISLNKIINSDNFYRVSPRVGRPYIARGFVSTVIAHVCC
jgi:hypothetical protein